MVKFNRKTMNKQIIKTGILFFIVLILLMGFSETLQAQCPMCKIAAQSNMKNGGTAGRGLNAGILYMLATPYLIVGTIGFIWWRNRKKQKEE